jgi:EPS-associated MarR family transcriptional regulator
MTAKAGQKPAIHKMCGVPKRHCRAVACPRFINLNTNTETHLKVLRSIEENPEITQRELSQELGVSLGKINYCLKALIEKGFVKARNFHNSNNKRAYLYKLTPSGIEAKARISVSFLRRKLREYAQLKIEIDQLENEINGNGQVETETKNSV